VAIANALHLEAARAMLVLSLVDYDAMPSLKSLHEAINLLSYYSVIAADTLRHAVTLTSDPVTFDF